MAITEKNRKILWARSGNQCAICRIELVAESTALDSYSVVGEECHIVSASLQGPRHDPAFKPEQFDAIENIVLLCATHHKIVDDQFKTYPADALRSIKSDHEKWVEAKLCGAEFGEVRIRRIPENIPATIPKISSGQDILAMASGIQGHYFDHDDDLAGDEVDLVGNFIQELSDWIDCCSDLEPLDRVRFASRIQSMMNGLAGRGFFVFAAVEVQRMEGGNKGPEPWIVLHVSILRPSNPAVEYRDIIKTKS